MHVRNKIWMWEWKIFSRMSTIRNMSSSLTLSTLPKLPMEIVKYILSMIRRIQIWEERLYANYKHMFLNVVMNEFKYKLVLQTIKLPSLRRNRVIKSCIFGRRMAVSGRIAHSQDYYRPFYQ